MRCFRGRRVRRGFGFSVVCWVPLPTPDLVGRIAWVFWGSEKKPEDWEIGNDGAPPPPASTLFPSNCSHLSPVSPSQPSAVSQPSAPPVSSAPVGFHCFASLSDAEWEWVVREHFNMGGK